MPPAPNIIGVLLAAGESRRMGAPKPALPWPPGAPTGTLAGAAFDAIAPFCGTMIVVVGREGEPVLDTLGGRSFAPVRMPPGLDMAESVRAGLRRARERDPAAAVLLHPADHPRIAPPTGPAILRAAASDPGRAIIPTWGGRGGHPVLIPPPVAAALLADPLPRGVRGFWGEHPELCLRVEVADEWVTADADTPEQYRAWGARMAPRLPSSAPPAKE